MNQQLAEAVKHHTETFIRALREGSGFSPPEAHHDLNESNRRLIRTMHDAYGQAWLGKINLYTDQDRIRIMWQYDPAILVCNFEAGFVVPQYDAELERLVQERDRADYEGTSKDAERLEVIMNRLHEIGGHHLIWS